MKRDPKTLIVDDSKAILTMMGNMLNGYGIHDVTRAANGLLALKCFEQALQDKAPVSLVFLDIVMPVMSGQAALKRMRGMEKEAGLSGDAKAVIIMATSLNSTADMIDAVIEGDCTDYLVKPFEAGDLRGMLIKYGYLE